MNIKKIREKVRWHGHFLEVELDNGNFIFVNDDLSEYKRVSNKEEMDNNDFCVTNISILDIIDDDEKFDFAMRNFDLYKVEDWEKSTELYNSYLDILLEAWDIVRNGKQTHSDIVITKE